MGYVWQPSGRQHIYYQYKILWPQLSKLCASSQELVLLPYFVKVIRFNYILGIQESVCYVMPNIFCWGSWERSEKFDP